MELIRDRLKTSDIQAYRTAYRTLALNIDSRALNGTRVLFEDGKIFKETDLLHSTDLYFLWLLAEFIPFANSLQTPWMISNGDAFLLDKIPWTDAEVKLVQKQGLNIFMYEPLFLLNSDRSWPWVEQKGTPVFIELEEIAKLQKRLNSTVRVFVCELDMPQYLKQNNLFPELEIHGFSTLLMHEVAFRKTLPWPTKTPDKITKHLVSLNFRYESVREMLVGFLAERNYLEKCYVSFFHEHNEREFLKRLPFKPAELEQWPTIKEGISRLQPLLPLTLDSTNNSLQNPVAGRIPDMNGSNNQRNFNTIKDPFMTTAFAFAYCESRPFSPRGEISEKTLDALQAMKPFVVFASPYFLKKLKQLGFKTFSRFWSEDYDRIEDPKQRFDAFLKTVDFICCQNIETLRQWTTDMQADVEHNRLLFLRHFLPQQLETLKNELRK